LRCSIVGGSPGWVEVVQGDHPVLDVGADAHFGGGADEDGDASVAAAGEQVGFGGVVGGGVDEGDLVGGDTAGYEGVVEAVVGGPCAAAAGFRAGGADVAEHDLEGSGAGVRTAEGVSGVGVAAVAVGPPDVGDPVGAGVDLPSGRGAAIHEAGVEGREAPFGADLRRSARPRSRGYGRRRPGRRVLP